MLWQVINYSLFPFIAALAGAFYAALRPPGAKMRSALQHFAAGVVFSVVAVELMPDVMREHKSTPVTIGFVAGIGVMLGIRSLTRGAGDKAQVAAGSMPVAMLAQWV